jgi:protocatechuate 3,4-dioxygenase beta subunit
MKRQTKLFSIFLIWLSALFFVVLIPPGGLRAAGTISGNVFYDLDADGTDDGANEVGVAGVTVTVYDAAGVAQGSASTNATGDYSINATGTGPYRVEFTNLPAGYTSGPRGTTSGTSVQFVPDGNSSNINFGVFIPDEFCQNNPNVATNCFVPEAQAGTTRVIARLPYDSAGNQGATAFSLGNKSNLGTVWGLAYQPSTQSVFSSAYMRRHANFGPGGPGQIYRSDSAGAVTAFVTIPNAGTNPHPTTFNPNGALNCTTGLGTNYTVPHSMFNCYFHDPSSFEWPGRMSLGDLDIYQDPLNPNNDMLFVVNMFDRNLYRVTQLNATPTVSAPFAMPLNLPGANQGCNVNDVRPFALTIWRDTGYAGFVCSAATSQLRTDLRAYIYSFNPDTVTFASAPLVEFPLNYGRGMANGATMPANWQPWINTSAPVTGSAHEDFTGANYEHVYPQPMLSDIVFDREGNITVGLRDRFGDQGGSLFGRTNTTSWDTVDTIAVGDTLKICLVAGAYQLESNGICGGVASAGNGTTPQGLPQGPGSPGNEFYYRDAFQPFGAGSVQYHEELSTGGLAYHPTRHEVMTTLFDPLTDAYTGGTRRFNVANGNQTGAFQLYALQEVTFSKSNGMGDVEILCDQAPVEVGNRVWRDNNNNGRQDPGEPVIAGVTVTLHNSAGTQIASAITDANGNYYFSSATGTNQAHAIYGLPLTPGSNYSIRINTTQAALASLSPTLLNDTINATDLNDSDGDPSLNAGFVTAPFTLGRGGANNHTYDFGFAPASLTFSLGNRVWFDTDNDGQIDGTEVGVNGVSVSLFLDANADGVPDTIGSPLATTTTADGGYYRFDNLPAETYVVRVNPTNFAGAGVLASYTSSTPASAAPNGNVDNDDNGINNATPATNGILSGPITLGPTPDEPTGETDLSPSGQGSPDAQANMTVDFGFFRLSVGNQLWLDPNDNGILDGGESGTLFAGVRVELYDGATLVAVTTTDATGAYLFDRQTSGTGVPNGLGLAPSANYTVRIPASEFALGEPLAPYNSSTGATSGTDSRDNGIDVPNLAATGISSAVFSLQPGNATGGASVDNPTATTNNPTLDFGFTSPPLIFSLGNRVWFDTDNDGQIDGTEVGVNGVSVSLFLSSDTSTAIATTTTADGGYYRFDNLPAETYVVRVNPSNFTGAGVLASYTSSTPTSATPNDNTDNDDNGINNATPATNGILSGPVTLGPAADEPTGETDLSPSGQGSPDAQANMTVDFGFFRLSVGNQLWLDPNDNGILDGGETGTLFAGVRVELYDGATLVAVTTTDATGAYLFDRQTDNAGVTTGLGLAPSANYTVRIPASEFALGEPLAPYNSSTGATSGTDSRDNGIDVPDPSTSGVSSAVFSLQPGSATGGASVTNPTATTNNPTLDFGFVETLTFSLGNRVWLDTDNDGTIDGSEVAINGVSVSLFLDANADGVPDTLASPVATTTTADGGYYRFDTLPANTYVVRVDPLNFAVGGPLAGYSSSTPTSATPNDNTDSDDNGIDNAAPSTNGILSGPVTLGPTANEPTGETDLSPSGQGAPDAQANMTVDFGFYRLTVGNQLWIDANNNGILDGGESGTTLAGVRVELYDGATLVAVTTTDSAGAYLFDRQTDGTGVANGLGLTPSANYTVRIPASEFALGKPLAPFHSSTGATSGTDSRDNGIDVPDPATTGISSAVFSLQPGSATGGATVANATATTHNPTLDFGFYTLSLGNLVWYDTNNNGQVDGGESGINNVTVNLYLDNDNNGIPDGAVIATTTTNATGHYLFTGLTANTYIVEIVPPAGHISSTGINGSATGPYEPAPDPDTVATDNDDNGTTDGAVIRSAPVTLTVGGEPLGEAATTGITDPAPDSSSNLTVDFGLFRPLNLGNLVWHDVNNSGDVDGTETGISGVTVELLSGATVVATTTTDGSGNYLFNNLTPGDYVVRIPASQFAAGGPLEDLVTSTGTNGSPTDTYEPAPDPDDNTDNDDNGTRQGSGAVQSLPISLDLNDEPDVGVDGDDTYGNLTVDFGFFEPASLGDYVWHDTTLNGVQDTGEPGVPSVTVTLYNAADDSVVATTTTDTNGAYLFDNLIPGDYYVIFSDLPTGYGFVPVDQGGDDVFDSDANVTTGRTGNYTLVAGQHIPTVDAGITQTNLLRLGNLVWADYNDNGEVDTGEPGIAGVTVELMDGTGTTVLATTTTDANGNYLFSDLNPGDYVVRIPASQFGAGATLENWSSSSDGGNYEPAPDPDTDVDNDDNGTLTGAAVQSLPVTLSLLGEPDASADTDDTNGNLTVDFGFVPQLASLGNYVWYDSVRNNIQDSSESGVPGVTVRLLDSTGTQIATTTTDASGLYLFDNLVPGTYSVVFVLPTGHSFVSQDIGGDDTVDSDANTTTGATIPTTLTAGENDLTWDAGIYESASIGDRVWYDSNNNGIQDSGETGIANVTVRLLDSSGTVIATTTTNSSGNYLFDRLEPGDYAIEFVPPAGYTFTSQDAGGDTTDSDADITTGRTIVTTLSPGEHDPTWDAGVVGIMSLGNLVWNDVNNNGTVDTGETGISGVTVRLLNGSGTVLATTTTDANGNYLFSNLIPGDYMVEIVPPAGLVTSTGTNGSASGPYEAAPDPDNDVDNDDNGTLTGAVIRSGVVTLVANNEPITDGDANTNSNLTIDFGLYRPASLGNYVWHDENEDGIQDGSESGVPGVTVTLYDGSGTVIATTTTDSTGSYRFDNLTPGSYSVGFSNLPVELDRFTSPNRGGDDALDSDADTSTGRTQPITLVPGEHNPTIDAGIFSSQPTPIQLSLFTAQRSGNGVLLQWSTSAELNTWGFHILRSSTGNVQNATRITSQMILANGGRLSGANYSWLNSPVSMNSQYRYWLEVHDINGSVTRYGPIMVQSNTASEYQVFLPSVMR